MKRLLQFTIMVCALLLMTVSAFAADSLVDRAGLLNMADRRAVSQALEQVEKEHRVRVAVLTIRDNNVTDVGKYSNSVLDRNYRNGMNGNMLLVINMANKKWYIATDNRMNTRITADYGVKLLGNSVADGLKNAKYKDALITYAKGAGSQLDYYKQNGKPRTAPAANAQAPATKKEKGSSLPIALGGGVILGALGAFIYGGKLKAAMSNVAAGTEADEYMKEESFNMTESDDTFMYTTYKRVKMNKAVKNTVDESANASDDRHKGAGGGF